MTDAPPRGEGHTPIARVFVRPIGSALPLGFFSFGLGMFLLGAVGVGGIPQSDVRNAGLLLVAFVFPLEFVSTIVAFLARDTVGATALGIFSTSWLSLGLALLTAEPGTRSRSLAYYLVFLAAVIVLLGVAAVAGKPLIAGILLLASARTILGAVYEFSGRTGFERAGGVVAFAISGSALYGGLAFLLEDVRQRSVLPVFRRGEAQVSIEGDLGEQLRRVESEAGVRGQM